MAKYSKINLKGVVVEILETDPLSEVEVLSPHGGQWVDYQLGSTVGRVARVYDRDNNIFREQHPVDINGVASTSWTLNTTTGVYSPPITQPGITTIQDADGKQYMWNEAAYQADTGNPKTVGWAITMR